MLKQKIKSRIILIGYKSFLQANLYKYLKKKHTVKKIRFTNIKKFKYKESDIVINFSNNYKFYKAKYNTKIDRNYQIAKIINKFNTNLIFISTRQVYKPRINITEKSEIQPMNTYAKNCLISENKSATAEAALPNPTTEIICLPILNYNHLCRLAMMT